VKVGFGLDRQNGLRKQTKAPSMHDQSETNMHPKLKQRKGEERSTKKYGKR
jgi:hypothetical protein